MGNFHRLAVFVAALLPLGFAAPVQPEAREEVTSYGTSFQSVPGSYIVTLKEGAQKRDHLDWVNEIHARTINKREFDGVKHHYDIKNFHAYAGKFDKETIDQIKKNPDVSLPKHLSKNGQQLTHRRSWLSRLTRSGPSTL